MEYIELNCIVSPLEPGNEILMAELAEYDYESFKETENGLKAYIQAPLFIENQLKNLYFSQLDGFSLEYSFSVIEDQNWNAKWEENYPPVVFDDKVAIRAPFHDKFDNVEFDIVIEPKMSFGTAHHATTAQMIRYIVEIDMKDLKILDMGSGTAVLAILASMRGAKSIDAIDNDEWAYNNAVENVAKNNITNINVELGDASLLNGRNYDLIIANINRNILLNDINAYAKCLSSGNLLLLSGFYEADIKLLSKEAEKYGLIYQSHTIDREWVAGIWKMN
jgi:ribosomal protein L11 methyltransferase